jgi:hypothetical protein
MRAIYAALTVLVVSMASIVFAGCFSDKKDNGGQQIPDVYIPDVNLQEASLPDIQIPDGGFDVSHLYAVGGTVLGLEGTGLVLEGDGLEDITIKPGAMGAPVTFVFPTPIPPGAPYAVVVKTQPSNPGQTCSVSNASGTASTGDVTNVIVNCATNTYAVGGTVTGFMGQGLILQNNGGDSFAVPFNGAFAFPTKIATGKPYAVTVLSNPTHPTQTCTVDMGTGMVAEADVKTVAVNCTTQTYTVGGQVIGLTGMGLVVQNGMDKLPISADGMFTFPTMVPSGSTYSVTVATPPGNPVQTCSVSGGDGTVAGGNVTSVIVNCSTGTYTVGGTVSGLIGTGLTLTNNGAMSLSLNANGSFAFFPPLATGTAYKVAVSGQPSNPAQSCSVANDSGTVGTANITNVAVTCTTATFKVIAQVSGLLGTGLVLENNKADDLAVAMDGSTPFATAIASGSPYSVSIKTPPSNPSQVCQFTGAAAGVVGTADVTVPVKCFTEYPIGGTITGLSGAGLTLINSSTSGNDSVSPLTSGTYQFPKLLPSAASYSVSIAGQPKSPNQVCTVANTTGVVGTQPITNVNVTCQNSYSITVQVVNDCDWPGSDPPVPFATITDTFPPNENVQATATADTSKLVYNGQDYVVTSTLQTSVFAGQAYNIVAQPPVGCSCFDPNAPVPTSPAVGFLPNGKLRFASAGEVPLGVTQLPPSISKSGIVSNIDVLWPIECDCGGCK